MTTSEIETETRKGRDRDYWVGETRTINGKELWAGHYFVHYGKKYAVTKTGETICTGPVAEVPPKADDALPVEKPACDTTQRIVAVGKSVVTDDVTAQIVVLAGQGKSCRVIEEELAKDGVFISYRTVARKLQGKLL